MALQRLKEAAERAKIELSSALSSPMQPEQRMVELRLPDVPCVIARFYVKLIGDRQAREFLHKLPGLRIVRLVARRCPDIHAQVPGPPIFWQHIGRTVCPQIGSIVAPDTSLRLIVA